MKIKSLYSTFLAIFIALFATSCDDNLDSIGQSIRPDTDSISLEVDNVYLTARTVSLRDYIYLENESVLLGEVKDDRFGSLKADFLGEFYSARGEDATFKLGYDKTARVDSVQLRLGFHRSQFMGDTIKPAVISVYEVTEPLESNYYTNIDPLQYCDMGRLLGQRFFSIQGISYFYDNGVPYCDLSIELDKQYGQDLYEEWVRSDGKVLSEAGRLKEFMKGIYVTTDFNDNAMIQFPDIRSSIYALVYYSYTLKKKHETDTDSTAIGLIQLPMGKEAIKMNRVINTPWENELENIEGNSDSKVRTLVKAPAGVMTELTIPLAEIKEKGRDKFNSDKFAINSAVFKLLGLTEEENELSITARPDYLLFINKDSLTNFFNKKKKIDGLSSLVMVRDSTNNSYNFSTQTYITANPTNNISTLINHYLSQEAYENAEDMKFLVIPVSVALSSSGTAALIDKVENLLQPAAAIFRTEEKHLKMSLAFSKHNSNVIR